MMVNFSVSKQHESIGMMMFYYYMGIRANAEMYFRTFASHQTFLATDWIKLLAFIHSFIIARETSLVSSLLMSLFMKMSLSKLHETRTSFSRLGCRAIHLTLSAERDSSTHRSESVKKKIWCLAEI